MSEHTQRDIVTRSVSLRAQSADEKTRSVEAVIATSKPAEVYDWGRWEPIQETLVMDGARFPEQVVLLENHNRWSLDDVLGSVRGIERRGEELVARLYFAEGDERAERAWNKVRQGHLSDVSIGYRVTRYVDVPAGQTQEIDGKTYAAGKSDLRVSLEWGLKEVSIVPIGADELAKIRSSKTARRTCRMAEERQPEAEDMDEEPEAEAAAGEEAPSSLGDSSEESSAEETAADAADEEGSKEDPEMKEKEEQKAAITTERDRVRGILALEGSRSLADEAIRKGWSVEQAAVKVLAEVRSGRAPAVSSGVTIHAPDRDRARTRANLSAGIARRAGLPLWKDPCARKHDNDAWERAYNDSDAYSDLSLLDVCREALRLAGKRVPHSREETIRSAVSSADLAQILGAVVNKQLMMSYELAEDSTQGWVSETDVPDFKTNTRVRLGQSSALAKMPAEGGEADHATFADAQEQYAIARYARQFAIGEQSIINDDLNALQQIPMQMGAAAADLKGDLVYEVLIANAALADAIALFHASHSNLNTSSALGKTTLETCIANMALQQEGGRNLNIRPAYLIVPVTLEFSALQLINSGLVVVAGSTDAVYGAANPVQGIAEVRRDARLDNGFTGPSSGSALSGSTTTWYMAGSGARYPTIEVGYLAGSGRRPVMRSFILDRGQWGVGWDVKFDLGAKALDYRALSKNTA